MDIEWIWTAKDIQREVIINCNQNVQYRLSDERTASRNTKHSPLTVTIQRQERRVVASRPRDAACNNYLTTNIRRLWPQSYRCVDARYGRQKPEMSDKTVRCVRQSKVGLK